MTEGRREDRAALGLDGEQGAEYGTERPHRDRGGIAFTIGLTIAEVVFSIAVFSLSTHWGAGQVAAYVYASLVPVAGGVVYFVRTRDVSGASIAIVAFNLLSAGVALVGDTSPRMLLYKDCFVTGIVGLIFLATLVIGKPLTFHYGQRFSAGTDPVNIAWWHDMWQHARFRWAHRLITTIWGVLLLAEAATKAVAIHMSSYGAGYVWTQVLPALFIGLGVIVTLLVVRRAKG